MAIQPIDLQALFSQIDKVGKSQALLREGQQIQDSLQQIQTQRKLEENVQSVNEAQETGEETDRIKDDKGRRAFARQGGGKGRQEDEEEASEEDAQEMIRNPALGRNIDISG